MRIEYLQVQNFAFVFHLIRSYITSNIYYSEDAGLSWFPEFPLPKSDKWNLPCARNMVRNSLCRMFMHGYWWINDPDCMLLRPSLHFSEDELQGIATVKAFSGGSFIISDDLETITPKRFRMALQLLPPTNVAAVPLDLLRREMPELLRLNLQPSSDLLHSGEQNLISPWTLVAVCNWDNEKNATKSHKMSVAEIFGALILNEKYFEGQRENVESFRCTLFLFSFWSQSLRTEEVTVERSGPGSEVSFSDIAHHSAHIYRVGLIDKPSEPCYIGSNLHFSCGLEVAEMTELSTLPSETSIDLANNWQRVMTASGSVFRQDAVGIVNSEIIYCTLSFKLGDFV